MIEKMNFITITGPRDDIDRVAAEYLTRFDIHLENALSELNGISDLKPFIEVNPYKAYVNEASELLKLAGITDPEPQKTERLPLEKSTAIIQQLQQSISASCQERLALNETRERHQELLNKIEHFRHLDYDLTAIQNFQFISCRFGRITHEHYTKFSHYVMDNPHTIFYECDSDTSYVWGAYFVPSTLSLKLDAIYTSLHFERLKLPHEYMGTPEGAYEDMLHNLNLVDKRIQELDHLIAKELNSQRSSLFHAIHSLETLNRNFDIRKKAACTRENQQVYYILCGWVTKSDTQQVESALKQDPLIFYDIDNAGSQGTSKPPTKLKNPGIFKPFETFISMYSLPDYREMDPTAFIALTYPLIFGIMFGDVGQGLLLAIGGYLVYRFKNIDLGAILALAGCFSTIFGFLYGSFFGYEHVSFIPTLWMKPMENIMQTLLLAVILGIGLILTAIIMSMINSIRTKNYGRLFFDTNGLAGFLFYGLLILAVFMIFLGKLIIGIPILVGILLLPLLVIFLKEPLTRLIERKKPLPEKGKTMFFVESFFELFEVLLSYITNSISFVRIGAFALSHAGMMEVVMMLGNATTSNPNYIIIVLGNLLVMGLEGLIVGIQVLRLEYYEMFSRFYQGNGRPFESYKNSLWSE